MFTVFLFILILSLLVLVHEAGHFFMARKFGMKVYEFGVGFPPRAFGIYKHPKNGHWVFVRGFGKGGLKETVGGDDRIEEYPATLYSINWLPLGGFVKIKGESGEKSHDTDSFAYHKAWKRLVVLVAGVFMNIVLAFVLLSVGFMIGLPTDVSQGVPEGAVVAEQPAVVVQQVVKDSPAELAGLKLGDKITSINSSSVLGALALTELVKNAKGEELALEILRGEELLSIKVTPAVLEGQDDTARLGILLADAAVIKYPWHKAIYQGIVATGLGLVNILIGFYLLLKNLILGNGLIFEVSGPVGIATIVGQSAKLGFNYLLNITAMISLSLAVINILPIPALDGGRALFVIIEKLIGRPVPKKYEQMAHTIGFIGLMALIVLVTYRDIVGLLG